MTAQHAKLPANKRASSLSPEQIIEFKLKELKKQRLRILGEFSFGMIKTVKDITDKTGLTIDYLPANAIVDKQVILHIFTKREEDIKKGDTAPIIKTEEPKVKHTVDDYPPLPSLKNSKTIKYQPFQNKAASQVIENLTSKGHRGNLLQAPVGCGKTFIYGAVISELWRMEWSPLMKTFSPFPVVIVTKATVVEQTERVMMDDFKLKLGTQVDVTNYDQLRSRFGENFIEEKTKHSYGDVEIYFVWKPLMAPTLMIWDECQSLKNIDSTQSKIAQAYNDIDDMFPTYQLFTSATAFTRVIEAKAFVVSTRLNFN